MLTDNQKEKFEKIKSVFSRILTDDAILFTLKKNHWHFTKTLNELPEVIKDIDKKQQEILVSTHSCKKLILKGKTIKKKFNEWCLLTWNDEYWDYDYITDIDYCPYCGKKLEGMLNE